MLKKIYPGLYRSMHNESTINSRENEMGVEVRWD